MHTLDLLILVVVVGGLLLGLRSGLIRQVAGIIGLLLSVVLGVQLMHPVGELATQSLGISERIAPLVGFGLVFVLVQIALFATVRMIEALIGALKLSFVNRLLGSLFGAFKAVVALSVLFLVLNYLGIPDAPTRQASALYAPVSNALPQTWDYVSERVPNVQKLSERFSAPADSTNGGEATAPAPDSPSEQEAVAL